MLPCTALVLSVILAFSAGCTSDNVNVGSPQGQQEPQVSLPQDEAQPTGTITFEAAGEWHIEISDSDGAVDEPDWLAVFPADGFAGDVELTVVAQPNTTGESRTAVIKVQEGETVKEYTINQGPAASVTPSQTLYKVMPDADGMEINVTANTTFRTRVTVNEDDSESPWIEYTGTSGSGTLTFSLKVNDRLEARNAIVEFLSENDGRQLGYCTVRQAGIRSISGNTGLDIKDSNFKAYLLEHFDKDHNGSMSVSEMEEITRIICPDMNIMTLAGIEHCTNLEYLDCSGNPITDLTCIMGCTALESLFAERCSLPAAILYNNRALKEALLGENPLNMVIIGALPELYRLGVGDSKLTSLDVSGCRSLEYLSASNCRISTVYLSGCTKLKSIYLVNNRLRHIDLRPFGNLIEYEANFVGNDEMESIHANINPSYSPDPDRLVVMWTTETSRHCMYMPYVYVKGKLVSQQVDLGIDLPI